MFTSCAKRKLIWRNGKLSRYIACILNNNAAKAAMFLQASKCACLKQNL